MCRLDLLIPMLYFGMRHWWDTLSKRTEKFENPLMSDTCNKRNLAAHLWKKFSKKLNALDSPRENYHLVILRSDDTIFEASVEVPYI